VPITEATVVTTAPAMDALEAKATSLRRAATVLLIFGMVLR